MSRQYLYKIFDVVLETIGIGAAVGYPWQVEVPIGGKSTMKCLCTVVGNLVKSALVLGGIPVTRLYLYLWLYGVIIGTYCIIPVFRLLR